MYFTVALTLVGFLTFSVISSVLTAPSASAAVGINPQLNYQGRLLNAAGAVVPDGTYNLEFKLYTGGTGCIPTGTSPCGGTNVWTEDWVYGTGAPDNRVIVRNGYFSVSLGSITSMASVDFNNDTLWLSANVGNTTTAATFSVAAGDGEMLPFKRLASSPYAMNAGKLGGLAAVSFLQLAQGVQTDASTVNASIFVNKTGATANILDLQKGGADVILTNNSGQTLFRPTVDAQTALQVQKAGTTTVVFTVDSTNSRIGIGTGAPAYAVDAVGSVNASTSLKVAGIDVCTTTGCVVDPTSAIQNQSAATQSASFKISGTGSLGGMLTANAGITVTNDILFTQGANRNITVAAATAANNVGFNLTVAAGAANGSTTGNTGGTVTLVGGAAAGTGNNNGGKISLDGGTATGTGTKGDVTLQGSTGNVGIGTTVATEKLQVSNGNLLIDNGNLRFNQITAPTAPTAAINVTAGTLTGTYSYKISFITNQGETSPGTASGAVAPSAQQVNLTAIPTGTAGVVTQRRIYRTFAGGSNYFLVTTLADNVTTSYTDNIPDGSLTVPVKAVNSTGGIVYLNGSQIQLTDSASSNTAQGYLALSSNTSGFANTAEGNSALTNNNTGFSNSALGVGSLQANTSGAYNTAVGFNALTTNVSGTFNSAFGTSALKFSTGTNNSAFGLNALLNNAAGNQNTAVGSNALRTNTAGNNNSALGYQALYSTIGSQNTALGYNAGYLDSTGLFKTVANLQNATTIGAYTQVQASNSIVLGSIDTATNVGIGTTIPLNRFSVSPVDYSSGTASQSLTTVSGSGTTWTTAMVGEQFIFADGSTGTITAFASATSLTLSTSQTVASQTYRIHKIGLQVTSAGDVGIGVVSPAATLHVAGSGLFRNASDSTTAFQVQNAISGVIFGVDTSAALLALNADVTVAATKSLKLTGGTTASRPASPTAGMLYYDSTTSTFIQYNGTKWVSDRSSNTKVVSASTASQAVKDASDYVATGTGDQTTINTALAAAAGGSVYLSEGTYTVNASVTVPNGTTLYGAGTGTIIRLPNAQNGTFAILTNTDQTTGTRVNIHDLQIDGNKANQTSGTMAGVYLLNMGGGSGGTARDGAKITNILIRDLFSAGAGYGIQLDTSNNNVVTGSTVKASYNGIYLLLSNHNTVSSNMMQGNSSNGLFMFNSSGNTVSTNTMQGNTSQGMNMSGTTNNNSISGNVLNNNQVGIYDNNGTINNSFTGNTASSNTQHGIVIAGNNSTITGNTTAGNGVYGLYVNSGYNSTITGNTTQGNQNGIYVVGSSNASLTGNTVLGNTITGISLINSYNITISGTNIFDSGGATSNNAIFLTGSYDNSILGNDITDTSCTTTCYALNISDGTSSGNYLADNHYGPAAFFSPNLSTINDLGAGTVYANQQDAGGNLIIRSKSGGLNVGKTSTAAATLDVQGGILTNFLPSPAAPTLGTVGAAGAISRSYAVSALDGNGETLAANVTTITTANTTLSGSVYVTINWAPVGGAINYSIYRTSTSGTNGNTAGLIGTVAGNTLTFNDTGIVATSALPLTNYTGGARIAGLIQGSSLTVTGGANVTSLYTTFMDTFTAANLNIGISTANKINIGKAGITTNFPGFVGIGTTTAPTTTLVTVGVANSGTAAANASIIFDNAATSSQNLISLSVAGTNRATIRADSGGSLVLNSTGTSALYLNNDSGTGGVIIGQAAFKNNLTVNGTGTTCTIGNGVAATNCTSDARLKNNLGEATGNLAKIMQLQPTFFTWKDPSKNQDVKLGLIAQNVQAQFPGFVITDVNGYLALDYAALVSPIIGAVKEQQAMIDTSRNDISMLQKTPDISKGGTINGSLAITASLNVSGATTLSGLTVTGNAVVQGNLAVSGDVTTRDLTVGGHLETASDPSTATLGAAAGTSLVTKPQPAVAIDGNDNAGTVTVMTGVTVSASGVIAEVTFAKPFVGSFKIALTPTNDKALDLRVYVEKTATGFRIISRDKALPSSSYAFDYLTIGTMAPVRP